MSFKSERIKAGKRVADVMEFMGVTDAAVYYWETGVSRPRAGRLTELAKFYGCTVDDLLKQDDSKNPVPKNGQD